jgi:hypothetical protein
MVILSQSRLAMVCLLSVWFMTWILSRVIRPYVYFMAATTVTFAGVVGVWLLNSFEQFWQAFRSARAGSTRVRETLARIAIDRWQSEAPIWGHGIVERGPHLVEYMPIGSHHSWYGLLFVKGIVGLSALAIPIAWSVIELTIKAQHSVLARTGLSMILVLFIYTFGENLEILSYLFWPALILIGKAHHEPLLPAADLSNQSPETREA